MVRPNEQVAILGKVKHHGYFHPGDMVEFQQTSNSWLDNEPGLVAANSISVVEGSLQPSVLIVNSTNRSYKVKRGSVLGALSVVRNTDTKGLFEVLKTEPRNFPDSPDFSTVSVPDQFRERLLPLLQRNSDVFAANPQDIGRTSTVKMSIDTKDSPPVRQRPYRIPLSQ